MTTLAKIFTVLLAVFAVLFSTMAITSAVMTQNYKQLAEDEAAKRKTAETDKDASANEMNLVKASLSEVIKQQQKKIDEMSSTVAKAQTSMSTAENKSLAESQKVLSLAGQVAQLTDMFNTVNTERKQLQEQLTSTRKQLTALETDNFNTSKEKAELQLQKKLYEQQIRLLTEQNVSLEQNVEKMRAQLHAAATGTEVAKTNDGSGVVAASEPQASAIKGEITQVHDKLASLSIGSAQGVAAGMEFVVYRSGQYLGKVKVTNVQPEESAGELSQVQGAIRSGDSVTDKFEF